MPKEQLMEQLSQNAPARKSAFLSQEAEAITEAIEADWHRLNVLYGLERVK